MRLSKILILFIVGFLVFGSAGIFGYLLFVKPYNNYTLFNFSKKKSSSASKNALTDPSQAGFEAAVALQNAGKLEEAQAAWLTWLANYPNTPRKKEALAFLGKANMELLYSPPAESKESYAVVKGDSLDRIARKQKSNPELIQRLNNLPNINLQIGEILFVPQLNTSLQIDRQSGILILKNHDQFVKSYPLLSFPTKGSQKKPPLTTTIVDRIATSGNKRTAFGDKKYSDSERIIVLRSGGNIVAAPITPASTNTAPASTTATTSAASTDTNVTTPTTPTVPAMPPGFVISVEDMKEVFPFVTKETSVTID